MVSGALSVGGLGMGQVNEEAEEEDVTSHGGAAVCVEASGAPTVKNVESLLYRCDSVRCQRRERARGCFTVSCET